MWQKEKLHVLSNFFFCRYVFKKLSAAEASESIYMRGRVKLNSKLDKYFFHLYIFLTLSQPKCNYILQHLKQIAFKNVVCWRFVVGRKALQKLQCISHIFIWHFLNINHVGTMFKLTSAICIWMENGVSLPSIGESSSKSW